MIRTVKDRRISEIRSGRSPKGFPNDLVTRAQRKLAQLDAAAALSDLIVPPSNQLEALRGDRTGQYSIRINRQWRLCFVWEDGDAFGVEIVDYH